MNEWQRFNVNSNVRVKLTDRGREVLRENCHALNARLIASGYKGKPLAVHEPKEDADGWSTWQLWALMHEFGDSMTCGGRVPFETEIELCVEPL